jgi:DNA-binding transcriptional MerR regulator
MEYMIQKLAVLAGVTTRTLRYYDRMGMLKPARINSSGYRIYGRAEVDKLQQILFYRELGIGLEEIRNMISSLGFDGVAALKAHRVHLMEKRKQLDCLISNVENSLAAAEGSIEMSDAEKFEGFKKGMLKENERKYGREVREKYGDETVTRSNEKLMGMSKHEFDRSNALAAEVITVLCKAMDSGDSAGPLAREAAGLHRQWLAGYWDQYSPEAHAGLGRMYADDERFRAYYDKHRPGAAVFLRDAILAYTGMDGK